MVSDNPIQGGCGRDDLVRTRHHHHQHDYAEDGFDDGEPAVPHSVCARRIHALTHLDYVLLAKAALSYASILSMFHARFLLEVQKASIIRYSFNIKCLCCLPKTH